MILSFYRSSHYDSLILPIQVQDESAQAMRDLLDQWAQAYDNENNVYWYNATSGEHYHSTHSCTLIMRSLIHPRNILTHIPSLCSRSCNLIMPS